MCFWICWTTMFIFIILCSPRQQFLSHVPNRKTWFTSTFVKLANLAKQNTVERSLMFSLGYTKWSFLTLPRQRLSFHKQTLLVRKTTGLTPGAQFVLTSVHLKTSEAVLLPVILLEVYPDILLPWWMRPAFHFPAWIYSLPRYTHFFLSQNCLQPDIENSCIHSSRYQPLMYLEKTIISPLRLDFTRINQSTSQCPLARQTQLFPHHLHSCPLHLLHLTFTPLEHGLPEQFSLYRGT